VRILATVPASEIVPRRAMMIWRDRIPAARLTVIAGAPGLGKSTLGTMIAAELSVEGIPGVISNLEDDPATVTRPRLDVAAADLERVHIIPLESGPTFPRDFEAFENLIRHTGSRYAILDPIRAHFHPERLVHSGPVLRELARIAHENACAIVAVHHTIQGRPGMSAIELIGGPSGGLAGTARAAYLYGYDPRDEDRRALACVKINGTDPPPALVLAHETVEYEVDGQILDAGLLLPVHVDLISGKEVIRRGARHKERDSACAKWLSLFLAAAAGDDYTRPTRECRIEAAQAGYGWTTLQRVSAMLRIEKQRQGGWGSYGWWAWRLPDAHPLRNPDAAVDAEPETEAA
jgi:putative DNA primase/helicase